MNSNNNISTKNKNKLIINRKKKKKEESYIIKKLSLYLKDKERLKKLKKYIFYFKICIIFINIIILFLKRKKNYITDYSMYNYKLNESFIEEYDEIENENNFNFSYKMTDFKYTFSKRFSIVEVKYNVTLYDNKTLIKPSDIKRLYDCHFFCYMKNLNSQNTIYSLANINQNRDFYCIEYLNINEKVEFGFIIQKNKLSYDFIFLFSDKIIDYTNISNINDEIFDPDIIIKNNEILKNEIDKFLNDTETDKPVSLISYFYREANFSTKEEIALEPNAWYFNNIYDNYLCFCIGDNCLLNVTKMCKYYFYLNIIDKNRYVYEKTDYIFSDFVLSNRSADHAYPVFREMINQNLSAHYLTAKQDIYDEYCKNEKNCLTIIKVYDSNKYITGGLLEKYLEVFLRLKVAATGAHFYGISNIFYDIEYISYIMIGHGVSYFKEFLYDTYLSCKYFNKMVIPPSDVFINIAKKYGWKEENIIRVGFPKWDEYVEYEENLIRNQIKRGKSIFLMFTWREMNEGQGISNYYLENIVKFIKHKKLVNVLFRKNITFYFTFHHMLTYIRVNNRAKILYKYIDQNQISEVLLKADLLITDFSSVIFEIIYRKKPVISYIPDAYDPNINEIYIQGYYDIINGLKNGTIYFENLFFDLEKAVNKVIFYIERNFELDNKLEKFYDYLGLNSTNNTKSLVEYLKSM